MVVNDLVLDANGQKMSKSKGNVVNPWDIMQRHGADAARLFVVASSQVWLPRRFDENAIRETAGRFLLTLRNVYSGIFAQYANFGWEPSANDPAIADRPALDRWILSRLTQVEAETDVHMTQYDATLGSRKVMQFFDEDVSKWYVRLSRSRFYDVDSADNRAAFATLHEVLAVTCRLLAPFAPFLTDEIHRSLTGESVHLAMYVRAAPTPVDLELEQAMDDIRHLATLAHAARDEANVKVRQPLPLMQCVVPRAPEAAMALAFLLEAELNVKRVEFVQSTDGLVSLDAKANFRALGKKFGKETPLVAAAVPGMSAVELRTLASGASVTIEVAGVARLIEPDDVTIIRRATGDAVVQEEGGYGVALDTAVTPELRAEGLSREVISRIQRLRKEAQYDVSDRITVVVVDSDAEVEAAAVAMHRDRVMEETLAGARACWETMSDSPVQAMAPPIQTKMHILVRGPATQVTDVEGRPVTTRAQKGRNPDDRYTRSNTCHQRKPKPMSEEAAGAFRKAAHGRTPARDQGAWDITATRSVRTPKRTRYGYERVFVSHGRSGYRCHGARKSIPLCVAGRAFSVAHRSGAAPFVQVSPRSSASVISVAKTSRLNDSMRCRTRGTATRARQREEESPKRPDCEGGNVFWPVAVVRGNCSTPLPSRLR